MKDYFIRLIFGLFNFGIILCIANFFQFDWLKESNPFRYTIILLIVVGGGWGGWYLYKGMKKEKK